MKRLIILFFLAWTAFLSAEAQETTGCTDAAACNYDDSATQDDGSCDYCSCPQVVVSTTADFLTDGYGLHVALIAQHDGSSAGLEALAGMKTYRVYAVTPTSSDRVTAVSGSMGGGILEMNAPGGFYQDLLGSVAGTSIQPLLFTAGFPALEYDSWITIGAEATPSTSGLGHETVSTAADPAENWIALFEPGTGATGSSFSMTTEAGGGWFVYPTSANAVPDVEGRVLLGQFTSSDSLSGSWNIQFVQSAGDDLRLNVTFSTGGLGDPTWSQPDDCPCSADADGDGICDDFDSCTDLTACNYSDPYNSGCQTLDECGICGGSGIPAGDCDCDGSQQDALGVCGGSCVADADDDGTCDNVDDCVGELDACGICNGLGEAYECGCADIPAGDCDCNGNQLDAIGNCGGSCAADADADGICDDVDACVGEFDNCGVCNGPGAIYECGCADIQVGECDCDGNVIQECGVCGGAGIPPGDCDCDGNQLDALGICGGSCEADADCDGTCDDLDDCVGALDVCGVCNGPGEIYACGCSSIPAGDCDCDGNQFDALGICAGTCASDVDGDGVCDDAEVPGCTNPFACNYDASATDDDGTCESDDAIGVCGGACTSDADGDGVCDDVDDCVGTLDACGVCNGPGDIYVCGCTGIPAGDCDCDGNQLDALGECGGSCPADTDGDGVCDDAEVDGCTNPFACNYSAAATDDDGSCLTEDAIGVCGGDCSADADGDGVCDNVDDCVGTLDACGVCNGPGEIYDCGCTGIPAGDCDCDGNQIDALGECGGSCPADTDGDGVCDDAEVDGCTNPFACNYSAAATDDDGSCLTADVLGTCGGSCTADADGDGVCDDVDDCVGTLDACGVCNGPGEIYDCGCTGIPAGDCDCDGNQLDALGECGGPCTADADGDVVCDDVDDCVGTLDACGVCNGPGDIYVCGCTGIPAGDCDCDGNQLDALGECGGSCPADTDGDGVCDDAEVDGCTNPFACNYSAAATDDDGSCLTEDAIGVCGGDCSADADGDGVCDNVDDCVGTLDACGVCNGPGEIYDCGCTGIPAGDCDCDGNQFDALGICGGSCPADTDGDGVCDDAEIDGCTNPFACNYSAVATDDDGSCLTADVLGTCGGSCTADADGDGVCDDVDACVGTLDACGVCNGPGEIYDCGCTGIPAGDCDCDGNQLDALGECGGTCPADTDGDGVCDDAEVDGCINPFACNYSAVATDDDGSCLTEDAIGVCGGDCPADADGDGVCDDVDACVGTLDACGVCNGPGEIYGCGCTGIPAGDCDCDGNQLDALGECGGTCPADTDGDGVCDDAEVDGCTNPFACNYSAVATDDDGSCLTEDAIGVCGGDCPADADGDGICDNETECVGTVDACGVCNGPGAIFDCGCAGTPIGDCDCNGNQLDAVGVCGGTCTADADGDGVCDDVDGCVGTLDACGICNGPGEIYDCGCTGIPAGDCDCDGNQPDAIGECGGSCPADTDGDGVCDDAEIDGCTNPFACNYSAAATDDDGSCLTEDAIGVCGGDCSADTDGDDVCDDVDDCVGTLDVCGVCNGPGEIYDCGCTGIPAGDCDCDGNQLDALGECGGPCPADTDGDGVCDDAEIDGCTNPFACNYSAAATDDDGSCLTEDAIGVCGGDCTADADGDGVCDDVDDCVGTLDVCGVCNGPGEIYECGCTGIPAGDCDCDGNQPDAIGECGGSCPADTDGDGVCDDAEVFGCPDPFACNYNPQATEDNGACFYDDAIGVCGGDCQGDQDSDGICDSEDTCFGTLDVCGVCNGPGAVYSCGCQDIEPGACDCDGNTPDAIGVCDGECDADENQNGICDDLEDSLCGPGSVWSPSLGLCVGVSGDCPTDLDNNGSTGAADLLIFLTQFGNDCIE